MNVDISDRSQNLNVIGAAILASKVEPKQLPQLKSGQLPIGTEINHRYPRTPSTSFGQFQSVKDMSRQGTPLPLPTTISFSNLAGNTFFPVVPFRVCASRASLFNNEQGTESEAQIAKSAPVATASFAMTQNPHTEEKEYYMRVDLNSVKFQTKTRPTLELHVVIDPKVEP